MAKDNLFLGFGRGKVGSVVFYRAKGVQVTRALNASPSNPQSALQLLQRVCFKSSSSAYSVLQDICNHSFEGVDPGTPSQSRFAQRNVAAMRLQLADYINSGDEEEIITCAEANFSQKDDVLAPFRPFVVSEGHAPRVKAKFVSGGDNTLYLGLALGTTTDPTYDEVISDLGLQRGDQLTFLYLTIDDTTDSYVFNGFEYGRIILEPANGNFSSKFIVNEALNSPNDKNRGEFAIIATGDAGAADIRFSLMSGGTELADPTPGRANTLAAIGIIVSRQVGSVWQRSDCTLVCRSDVSSAAGHLTFDHSTGYLADAIASYKTAGAVSTRYLNQAVKAATTDE